MLINCSTVVNKVLLRLTVYWAGTELSIDGDWWGWKETSMENRWGWITECTGAGGDGCKGCRNRRDESEILSLCRPLVDVCSKKQILCML